VAKRSVPEQKLLLTAYKEVAQEKSIDTKMNDVDLYLDSVLRACRFVNHCVTFGIEYLANRIKEKLGSKGPRVGNDLRGKMVKWPMTSREHAKSNS